MLEKKYDSHGAATPWEAKAHTAVMRHDVSYCHKAHLRLQSIAVPEKKKKKKGFGAATPEPQSGELRATSSELAAIRCLLIVTYTGGPLPCGFPGPGDCSTPARATRLVSTPGVLLSAKITRLV